MSCLEQQQDEFSALEAIFGEDCDVDTKQRIVNIYIPSKASKPCIRLVAHLPANYPDEACPVAELHAPHLPDTLTSWAVEQLETLFSPGDLVLYNWVEWLKEEEQLWQGQQQHQLTDLFASGLSLDDDDATDDELAAVPEASEARVREFGGLTEEEAADVAEVLHKIISAEPITERKSTFQAHLAPVTSVRQVSAVVSALLQNNKIRNATHNMMAYRIHVPEKNAFLQDYDDDGETAAGARMLHLLQVADCRNVVVVVSRWFGGVLLGPSRFTYINNAARMLLEREGFIVREEKANSSKKKGKSK